MMKRHFQVLILLIMLTMLSCAVQQAAPITVTIQQTHRATIKSIGWPTSDIDKVQTPTILSTIPLPTTTLATPFTSSLMTTPSSTIWIVQPQLPVAKSIFPDTTRIGKVVAASSGYVFFLPYESKGALVLFDIANRRIITDTFIGAHNKPSMPYDILLGRDGTVWTFGSNDRASDDLWMLRRYDGQKKQFVSVHDNQGLLRANGVAWVQHICEDLHSNLWSIIDERIIRYTPVTGDAKQITLPDVEYKQQGLKASFANIYCDGQDNIWLIVSYESDSKTVEYSWKLFRLGSDRTHLTDFTNAGQSISGYSLGRISVDQAGILWIVDLEVGLIRVDTKNPANWEVIRPSNGSFTPESLFNGRDGKLWITNQGNQAGIIVYDPATTTWERASDVWSAVGQSDDGAIWAADANQVYKISPIGR
jgi:hypothetical protein